MEKFRDEFYNEASEQLEQLEARLLELEQTPDDDEIISAVFRGLHTIKGGAGMFGFDEIKDFTHEIETAFEYVREGKVLPSPELVTITLLARDHIKELMNSDGQADKAAGDAIITSFRQYVEENKVDGVSLTAGTQGGTWVSENEDSGVKRYSIYFKPAAGVFLNGTNPILLLDEVASLGEVQITVDTGSLPDFASFNPEQSYLAWNIVLTSTKGMVDVQDVFIFLDSDSIIKIEVSKEAAADEAGSTYAASEAGAANLIIGDDDEEEQPAVKAEAAAEKKEEQPAGEAARQPVTIVKSNVKDVLNRSVKVDSEKLDKLVDLVGELVTFSARLSQVGQESHNASFASLAEQADRLIGELRDTSMGMRMVPIGTTFNQFKRTVRDLANALNKDVQMIAEGEETELDKTVIERLNTPIMHIIRNSMDHGIELPEQRAAAGKDRRGTVKLVAEHSGAFVDIIISDDGAGLNREKILKKAVEKELISGGENLTDEEVYDLIFAPGFSTAEKVTDVSGRGVGMDVVKKEIAALGGSVQVKSKAGEGSSFTLKIPLTLAIIEGLMAKIANAYYIFPLSSVEECSEFSRATTEVRNHTDFINWREQLVPYVNLRQYFNLGGDEPVSEQIVIVNDNGSYLGFVVDKVIGNLQTVIKPLGKFYRNARGISGATILGDGTVALILDLYKLADMISQEDKALKVG
ncbi:MAG: chemotaxis protein CheA [Spirochaetaceae bacterium]|nr:chemotaxis protein CheA [Spirochaetaceae bacterium]